MPLSAPLSPPTPGDPPPQVWALLGHRVGDNAQIRALGEGLSTAFGWPVVYQSLSWRHPLPVWTPLYGRRAHLKPLDAPDLTPPWPDLVLAIGWRSVPIARWIAAQSSARLVHLGRPRAPLSAFDLVVTTPQYGLPDASNVLRLEGPLTQISPETHAEARAVWAPQLVDLPRPWIATLVGGAAGPLHLGPHDAARLGTEASQLARAEGGSVLVATGPRTGEAASQALIKAIDAPHHAYLWGQTGDNPYPGYLALADGFIVTGDSISMMHEASLTDKPLWIFPLPRKVTGLRPRRPAGPLVQAMRRYGLSGAPRDADAYSARLINTGRAAALGPGTRLAQMSAPRAVEDGMQTVVRAIHDLMFPAHGL